MNPGGFLEPASSTEVRSPVKLTLPDRGPFQFPAPYGTVGIRLTNASDMHGADALWYCGYSYWPNVNCHTGQSDLLVFLGIDRQRGGDGPSLWRVDKATDQVTPLGPIFDQSAALSWATGEGWYWSATEWNILYASDQTHLYRVDVSPRLAGQQPLVTPVVTMTEPGRILWQWHTSNSGAVHSATVKDAESYLALGSVVYVEGESAPYPYPAKGGYDECQIDKGGEFLLTKDNIDGQSGEDNVIYTVGSAKEPRILYDEEGAAGHSDNGFAYMVAADNWNSKPSAFRLWQFDPTMDPQGRLVYYTSTWDAELNHVSHCNAQSGRPDRQYVLGSSANRVPGPRNNEIIGFRLDGSCEVLVVAPVLTDLNASGGGSDDYAKLPKGNVDVTGTYFLWTANNGSDRLDAFLVKVPAQLLVPPAPPPANVWTVIDPSGSTRRFQEVP